MDSQLQFRVHVDLASLRKTVSAHADMTDADLIDQVIASLEQQKAAISLSRTSSTDTDPPITEARKRELLAMTGIGQDALNGITEGKAFQDAERKRRGISPLA